MRPAQHIRRSGCSKVGTKKYVFSHSPVQAKLNINEPGDMYEQEADSIANKIMQQPATENHCPFFQPKPIQTSSIQKKESASTGHIATKGSVDQTLNSNGQPMDKDTRSFMEQRFGYDFKNVKVHNDSLAHQSSAAINALAYTHANHVVFGEGQYQPDTSSGKGLLAHELTHVIQQGNENLILRKPAKAAAAQSGTDIIISLDDDSETKIQSGIRIKGAKQIRAYSVQDLVTKLGKLSGSIDNIIIFSHGSGLGAVKFVDRNKKETWVDIANLAKALSGKISIQVNNIKFEGCSLGNAGAELKSFGKAINATGVKAHSCFTFNRILKGIKIGRKFIKKRSDVKKEDEATFQKTLIDQTKKQLVAANGTAITDCVEGITPGTLDINELEAVFFANNGVINSEWDSVKFNNDWQPGSICKRDRSPTTSPCKLMEITP